MKKLRYIFVAIVFILFSPSNCFAENESYELNVGDQQTVYIYGFHEGEGRGEWSVVSDRSAIKIVDESDYHVTFKVLKWVQHECLIRYEWRYGTPSLLKTYDIFVRIRKPNITLSASPSGGKIDEGERVYLTCNKSDAEIYYTLDGYNPILNALRYYSTGIIIEKSCTLKAYASWGGVNSDVIEEKYTVDSAPAELSLTANPPGGLVYKDTKVYLNTNESGTDIYYTLDGSTPSKYSTPYNSSGVAIDKDCTLKAIAYKGDRESSVLSESYTLYTDPTSISVILSKSSINVGETTTATYTLFPWNATSSVSWSSENTDIAEVSNSGNVVGISAGTTRIRATTANGLSDYCSVTVSGEGSLFVSKTRFPDEKFREYLINHNILTEEDVKNVSELYLSFISPLNLKGIEYFTSLKKLSCFACNASSFEFDFSNNTDLEILQLNCCGLSSLDVSKYKSLKELDCTLNRIKGENMDALINSLPYNTGDKKIIRVIDYEFNAYSIEGNECTAAQVSAAKARGWIPYYRNERGIWLEYEGKPIAIDATYFPDANFRQYLLEQNYGKDGVISEDEILEITSMSVDYKSIENLKGIEYFTALLSLNCSGNKLNSLDVSKNTALKYLGCSSCQLTKLNVSRNTALTRIDCSGNKLTSLEVSSNIALTSLDCYNNQIKGKEMDNLINSLPYNYSSENYIIRIRLNPNVEDGNVCTTRQAAALKAKGWVPYCSYYDPDNPYGMSWREYEGFDDTAITIDANTFPDNYFRQYLLEQDYGKDRIITEEEMKRIYYIDVSGSNDSYGNINSLQGIEYFTELNGLYCNHNRLNYLDVSRNTKLSILYCYNNNLESLDISKNTELSSLYCGSNQLKSLEVSNNTALTNLNCVSNQLKLLDVSKNIALRELYCNANQLESLDVSKNTALTKMNCSSNNLKSLILSEKSALTVIMCYNNQINGANMDVLISSLPQIESTNGEFYVVYNPDTDGNVCTTDQVAAAKAKGWTPYCYRDNWVEYIPVSIPSKLYLTFIIMNNTEEVVNLTRIKFLLNSKEGVIGAIMTLNDSIPYLSIPPGENRRLIASMKGEYFGDTFVNSELLEQLGYKSNVVLYDENNSTTTYVPEMIDPSKLIEDGKKFAIIINQNASGINTPSFTEESRNIPIFNLNGQRMEKPRKGINIIRGKKVLIK